MVATVFAQPSRPANPAGTGGGGGARPNPAGLGFEAARENLRQFKVADGLEATLFAAEPMLVNPTDMDIDARGRVWITEGANYRITPRMNKPWGTLREGGDRIVILEDTNGDGVADVSKTFYQDPTINSALGIGVFGNRVIVSASPYVFILTDTDGDDRADQRELFFEDTSLGDHDHCTHAFIFGPDGKFYFNFGNEIRELRRPKAGLLALPLHGPVPAHESETVIDVTGNAVKADGKPYRQGMIFRCNPDGSQFETIAWNFRNNYETAIDSYGNLWQSDNDDDGNRGVRINFVMEFGNYGFVNELNGAGWQTAWRAAQQKGATEDERPLYHFHQYDPGVVPNLLQTFAGSPTGITVYEGKLLPAVWQGQMLHTDCRPSVTRAYPVAKSGAGYTATITNLFTSFEGENWYRPADVCVAPDGSVYIADWNDGTVGGHNMTERSLDTMSGRVYRIAPPGHKPVVPKLDLTTPAGAVAALQSPNMATRYLAWTALHDMQGRAERALNRLWADGIFRNNAHDPLQRARALWLLAQIKGKEKKYVEQALKHENEDFRIVGLRLARQLKLDLIPYLRQLAKDPSPQVRREVAIALRHHKSPEAPALWATLAAQHDGQDRWYLEALGIGADQQWDAFFAAWLQQAGVNTDTPAARDITWRARTPKALPLLAQWIKAPQTSEKDRTRYFRSLDFIPGPEKDALLVELLTATPAAP